MSIYQLTDAELDAVAAGTRGHNHYSRPSYNRQTNVAVQIGVNKADDGSANTNVSGSYNTVNGGQVVQQTANQSNNA